MRWSNGAELELGDCHLRTRRRFSRADSLMSFGPYQALYLHQTARHQPSITTCVWINGERAAPVLQSKHAEGSETLVPLPALRRYLAVRCRYRWSVARAQTPNMDGSGSQDRSGNDGVRLRSV